jgi:putative transposase
LSVEASSTRIISFSLHNNITLSVKCEKIFLKEFKTVPELLSGLKEYSEFYIFERPHQSLGGKTPAKIYWGREVVKKAA